MKKTIIIVLVLFGIQTLNAQTTYLDSSFGINGKVVIPVAGYSKGSVATAIKTTLQPNGNVLVFARVLDYKKNNFHDTLLRTDRYGKLDTAFDNKINRSITRILVDAISQADNKIVICTRLTVSLLQYATIERLNQDGSDDTVFNKTVVPFPYSYGDALKLTMQDDGKILLAGGAGGFIIRRYLSTGKIDSTFGTNGQTSISCNCSWTYYGHANSVIIQQDKKILMIEGGYCVMDPVGYGGDKFFMARVDSSGKKDPAFIVKANTIWPNVLGEDIPGTTVNGAIYTTPYYSSNSSGSNSDTMLSLSAYNPDGVLRKEYDSINLHFSPTSIMAQNNKLLLGGYSDSSTFEIARYDTLGKPDSSFNNTGRVTTRFTPSSNDYAFSMAIQPDGKIILGGSSDTSIALARYTNASIVTGTINFSQKKQKLLIFPNPIHDEATLQYTLEKEEQISINVYDITGRIVKTILSNQDQLSGMQKQQMNLNELKAGTYIIRISNGEGNMEVKIVKE